MDKQNFTSITMDFFSDGMVIPCDIYETIGPYLVAKKGSNFTESLKGRLHHHSRRGNGLFVLTKDYYLFEASAKSDEEKPDEKSGDQLKKVRQEKIEKLEEELGFTEVKENVLSLLDEIGQKGEVQPEKIRNASAGIANQLENTRTDVVISLVNMLTDVDEYLHRHSANVSMLNGIIGKWLGLPGKEVDVLITVGLAHDCGKALVPLKVLNSPLPLSGAEYEIIKMHPVHSFNLLEKFPKIIRYGARAHHEKLNGRGYPDHLPPDKVPVTARITAVSDIYDALVSSRVYKDPHSPFKIMTWLKKMSGEDLDPFIVDVFIKNMPRELLNKSVLLSNGKIGTVVEIDPNDLEFPYVNVGGKKVKTSEQLFCISMEL